MNEPRPENAGSEELVAVEDLSFEQALSLLEETVRLLEDGQIGLDESLQAYERGVKLLRRCWSLLENAERKVELLSGLDAQGNPVTQPFQSDNLPPPAVRRRQKDPKARPGSPPPPPADAGSGMDEPGELF